MRTRVSALAVLCLFSLVAFAGTPEEQIMQADRDFNKATQQKRAEGWLSYFALDDAAIPTPPTAGRQAIEFKFTWEPLKAEVFPAGNIGYTSGKYTARFKGKDGKMMQSVGRYITVWQKQEDGSWKIITDTGAADGPAQPIE
jgi:ketosteroid isomerase-like protein